MQYLLGIDVGTTGTKTILFRQDGQIIGQAYRGYPIHTPQVSFCEQDPQDWWNAVCETVKEVSCDPAIRQNIVAISMSTQGGTTVFLDESNSVIRPAIVWNDKRCTEELADMQKDKPDLDVYRICGWRESAAMPALQCRWLKKHEPENFAKVAKVLGVPDYLALRMTGNVAVDISNAGICRFVDIEKRTYNQEILDYAGVTQDMMPSVLPSAAPIGKLTTEAAKAMNLPMDVLLVSGAHDQYAVSLGAGACKDGDILIGSGTSWVITSLSDGPDFASGLAQSVPAVPGMWGSLRSLSSGGICLEWWRKNLTVDEDGSILSYDRINEEVTARKAAEEGLFFFPFAGLCDDRANFKKATFLGLDLSHDRFHLARAVMESVVFQILWMMESFRAKPSEDGIILAGGASKSKIWSQMLADISGLPVRIPATADLACVGAAVMAGVGCGLYPSAADGYKNLAVVDSVILPDPEKKVKMKNLYLQYKTLAKSLGLMYNNESVII